MTTVFVLLGMCCEASILVLYSSSMLLATVSGFGIHAYNNVNALFLHLEHLLEFINIMRAFYINKRVFTGRTIFHSSFLRCALPLAVRRGRVSVARSLVWLC